MPHHPCQIQCCLFVPPTSPSLLWRCCSNSQVDLVWFMNLGHCCPCRHVTCFLFQGCDLSSASSLNLQSRSLHHFSSPCLGSCQSIMLKSFNLSVVIPGTWKEIARGNLGSLISSHRTCGSTMTRWSWRHLRKRSQGQGWEEETAHQGCRSLWLHCHVLRAARTLNLATLIITATLWTNGLTFLPI